MAFSAAGKSGVNFLNTLLVIDLTLLKWRGLVMSILSTPFIVNCWFAGLIVGDLQDTNWKWGYGMFAIIIPVVLLPAIFVMTYFDKQANISDHFQSGKSNNKKESLMNYISIIRQGLIDIDAFGLLLLGFGFALLLLPFSLAGTAENGWRNPSLIAMMVIDGALLITFGIFEYYFSAFPSMPIRVLNRTLVMSLIIDSFYFLAGYIGLLYFSSYVFVVKDWSYQNWTYFNNALTLALCVFGVIAGICFRFTHRYKMWQLLGLSMRIISYGILIDGKNSTTNTARLIVHPILAGGGGGFSVVA